MNYFVSAFFSLSIGIGAVIGLIRSTKTDRAFLPFLVLTWVGFLNELVSLGLMQNGYSNVVPFNLFVLAEALLLTWQFHRWGLFQKSQGPYYGLQAAFIAAWVWEAFIYSTIVHFSSYFVIGHAFLIVLM